VARSLIDELLLEAADASAPCAPLLRKALVVAAKLGVDEVPQWINCELSGYYGREEIPLINCEGEGQSKADASTYRRAI
jgi:hypothetical protein